MRSKIVTYVIFLVIGIAVGAGGYYVLSGNSEANAGDKDDIETLFSCGMHPEIIENEKGTCPICGMNLTPIKNSQKTNPTDSNERKIIYWRAPMNPNEIYDEPGKSQMGMELVPVYEDEGGASGVVTVDGSVLQSMNVKMESVQSRNLSSIINTNGILETDERKEFVVTTKFDGWIEKLYINFTGQKVNKGEKLVDIYSPELVAAQQELITATTYDSSLNGSINNEMINNAKRKLELFDIQEDDINKIIQTKKINKFMTLYAPFNGTVLFKNVLEGKMIKAGQELIKIADLSNLWLKADIYESELGKIEIGSVADVIFTYSPEKIYSGKVTFIYPTVKPNTRTVEVRIDINNIKEELKPAMFGNVTIKGKDLGNITTIPEMAVLRNGKSNIVILSLGEGKFKPVEVQLGLYSEGYYQVLSGVRQNDVIVSSGQFMIDSESSLRSAVKLFSSEKKIKSVDERMEIMDEPDNSIINEEITSTNVSEVHNHETSIIHEGVIDVEAIDINGDGKVFQDPMDWNVISDEEGRCPLCGMFLKEVTIEDAKKNLNDNGFKYE